MSAALAGLLRSQAVTCLPASPLTHRLLSDAAEDLDAGGVTAEVLADTVADPPGSVPGLRLAAAFHRLVLTRQAPRLALHYPSVGGAARLDSLWRDAADGLAQHREQVRSWITAVTVQTNEVGRSASLWGGLQVASQQAGGLGMRLLEVGASAGLNLRPDRVALQVGDRDARCPRLAAAAGPALDRAPTRRLGRAAACAASGGL